MTANLMFFWGSVKHYRWNDGQKSHKECPEGQETKENSPERIQIARQVKAQSGDYPKQPHRKINS